SSCQVHIRENQTHRPVPSAGRPAGNVANPAPRRPEPASAGWRRMTQWLPPHLPSPHLPSAWALISPAALSAALASADVSLLAPHLPSPHLPSAWVFASADLFPLAPHLPSPHLPSALCLAWASSAFAAPVVACSAVGGVCTVAPSA